MVLHPKNSRIEFVLAQLIFVASFSSLAFIELSFAGLLALGALVGILFVEYLLSYFQGKQKVESLSYNGNSWRLFIAGNTVETAAPRVRFFSEFLITVDFPVTKSKCFRLMFFPDSLNEPEMLKFRRYLRFENLSVN